MKLFGRILVGIVAMVLAGLAVYGVGVVIKNNNDKNSNTNSNVTLSIQEARELVDKAYTACKGDSNSLSTAALKTQSAVEEDQDYNLQNTIQMLLMSKIVLQQGGGKDVGFIKSDKSDTQQSVFYFAYRLTATGVEVNLTLDYDDAIESDEVQDSRTIFEIYYLDAKKETWQFSMYLGEVKNELGDRAGKLAFNESDWLLTANGKNFELLKVSMDQFKLTKSVYSDNLNVSDIDWVMYQSFDYVTKPTSYVVKIYGATQEKYDYVEQNYNYLAAADMQEYTTEELNQLLVNYRQRLVNAYSPNFYEVTCVEYDIWKEVARAYHA